MRRDRCRLASSDSAANDGSGGNGLWSDVGAITSVIWGGWTCRTAPAPEQRHVKTIAVTPAEGVEPWECGILSADVIVSRHGPAQGLAIRLE